ncbi:MAG: PH domain-containing protein [Bacteroidales bacterium]
MGLFDHFLGNASEISPEEIEKQFKDIMFEGEEAQVAFKIFRDKWLFTNKRLIMLDVQGITGSKKEYHSIPYKSIYHFSVEMAGTFDLDCELKIWLAGQSAPIQKELKKGVDVLGLQKVMAYYVCNK